MTLRSTFASVILAAFALTAAAAPAFTADVTIGIPNWPSANATGHLIGEIITEKLGLSVDYVQGDVEQVFAGIANGTIDIVPEVWSPNHDAYTWKLLGSHLMMLSKHRMAAAQGLCTTRATADKLDLHSIEDLKRRDVAAALDTDGDHRGEIWAGAPGWASTRIEHVRAKSYGYDQTMQLLESDERTAMAALDVADAEGKPFVFYCYQPNAMFMLHGLVILKEPPHDPAAWDLDGLDKPDYLDHDRAASAWDASHIAIGYRTALKQDMPRVAGLLDNVALDTESLSAMTYALSVEQRNPTSFAQAWIANHPDAVETWVR